MKKTATTILLTTCMLLTQVLTATAADYISNNDNNQQTTAGIYTVGDAPSNGEGGVTLDYGEEISWSYTVSIMTGNVDDVDAITTISGISATKADNTLNDDTITVTFEGTVGSTAGDISNAIVIKVENTSRFSLDVTIEKADVVLALNDIADVKYGTEPTITHTSSPYLRVLIL